METIHDKPLYVHIANMTAKLVNLQNFIIVETVSNAPSCLMQARDDKPCITESRGEALTQCSSFILVHTAHYQRQERQDTQVNRHNAIKNLMETQIEIGQTNYKCQINMSLSIKS